MGSKWALLGSGAVLLAAATLSGCASTPGHGCPLDHGLGCHSLPQAYAAAVANQGGQQSVFSKGKGHDTAARPSPSPFAQPSSGYPQAGPGGTPVWTPGQVYRAWTAPWTDAAGYLHSGGYVYFTTPGHWSYGSLQASGPGSGILQPIAPSQLGFRPQTKGEPLSQQKTGSVDGAAQSATNYLNGGITQPQEQLTP